MGFSLSSESLSSLPGAYRCSWNFCVSCRALTFVYPFGATLNVMKPAVAILSTGSVCFPLNRPILAFYQHEVWAAWGTPCLPPAPHRNWEWIFRGFLQTHLNFWCICKLQMRPTTPEFSYDKLLSMGFRGALMRWSAEITYFWLTGGYLKSFKVLGFFSAVLVIIS